MKPWLALLRRQVKSMRHLGRMVRQDSIFKLIVIFTFGVLLAVFLGLLFYGGFNFLERMGGAGLMIINRLFALFFFGLAVMLVVSGGVTAFTTMFRQDEIQFLLLRPLRLGQIVVYKAAESAVLSSWAFFFIILPFLAAYAIHEELAPSFFGWSVVYAVPFVALCSMLGALLCLLMVRWLPSRRIMKPILWIAALAAVALFIHWLPRTEQMVDEDTLVLAKLIPGVRVASQPWWPSWWMSEGIMAMSRDVLGRGLIFLGLIISSMLVVVIALESLGERIFYDAWQRVTLARSRLNAHGRIELRRVLSFLPRETAALVTKEVRTFFRDPAQWTQVIVFFGLLAIYFANLQNMRYHMLTPEWRNLIAFLNMFSIASVICSLSARFIYPQMSLEGHGYWVIGMSPVGPVRVLRVKLIMAVLSIGLVSVALTSMSAWMLRVDKVVFYVALGIMACLSVAVCGQSLGLGTLFADPRERNPAAIVSSFGGTLNLVMSIVYTFLVMIPWTALFHLRTNHRIRPDQFSAWATVGLVAMIGLSIAWAWLPLEWGRRKLVERED